MLKKHLSLGFYCFQSSLCRIWTYINQKLALDCSRGCSRKQVSRFFLCGSFAEARFAGICHFVFYISYITIDILYNCV